MERNTKKLVIAALMTAFTCVATMVIKISTPTFGYIHLGDGLVLLCGIVLGPAAGGLAAGIGSMFADLFSGYVTYAPATFLIKALTAAVAGFLYLRLRNAKNAHVHKMCVIIGGIVGEVIMVAGYFLYETVLAAISSGGFTTAALAAGAVSSAAGVPFNIIQGITGIVVSLLLLPVLLKIPVTRNQILAPQS